MTTIVFAALCILMLALVLRIQERKKKLYEIAPATMQNGGLKYGGFWRRLGALLIDAIVLVPLLIAYYSVAHLSRGAAWGAQFGLAVICTAYMVCCHAKFGRTIGKWVTGLRVVQLDGSAIGWRHAWLRSSVDIGFSVMAMLALAMALQAIPDEQFFGVDWNVRVVNITKCKPAWLARVADVQQVWFWSEVVVMLFNEKRRALHDYIAGTVVVVKR